jgi:hypothetical protein
MHHIMLQILLQTKHSQRSSGDLRADLGELNEPDNTRVFTDPINPAPWIAAQCR